MNLTLYVFEGTPRRINKTDFLTQIGTISNVYIKEDTDILHPRLILTPDNAANPIIFKSNYCYVDYSNRYYYIDKTDLQLMPGNALSIGLTEDVLYTYANDIINSYAYVDIGGKNPDTDEEKMTDGYMPLRQDKTTGGIDFPTNPFDGSTNNILLILSP